MAEELDLTKSATVEDVELLGATNHRTQQEHIAKASTLEDPKVGFYRAAWNTTLTQNMVDWYNTPEAVPDPSYTNDVMEADLKAAVEGGIDPSFVSTLQSAHSAPHMKILVARAMEQQKTYARLAEEEGISGPATVFLMNMFDPAALVAGGIVAGPAGAVAAGAAKALYTGYKTSRVAGVLGAGIAGAAVPEVIRDQVGVVPVTAEDYLWAAGAGAALGGTLGAMATFNPREAAAFAKAGMKTMASLGHNVPGLSKGVKKKIFGNAKLDIKARAVEAAERNAIHVPTTPEAPPTAPPTASLAEPVGSIEFPGHPGIEVPINSEGQVVLYRGEGGTDAPSTGNRGRFFSSSMEEANEFAKANNGTLKVIKFPKEQLKDIQPRSVDGKPVPGETNFRVTREMAESAQEYVPPKESLPEPVAAPEETGDIADLSFKMANPLAPDGDDIEISIRDIAEATGLRQADEVAVNPAEIDRVRGQLARTTEALREMESTAADFKNKNFVGRYSTDDGSEFIIRAAKGGDAVGGPYNVMRKGPDGTAFTKFNKTPLNSLDEAKALAAADEGSTQALPDNMAAHAADLEDFIADSELPITPDDALYRAFAKNKELGQGDARALKNAYGLGKKATMEDVVKAAQGKTLSDGLQQNSSAGAARVSTIPEALKDPSFKAVNNDNVPRVGIGGWAGFLNRTRFDRAGAAGKSINPITRLLGPNLMNESVGMADHSLNPMSAMVDKNRIFNTYMGQYAQVRSGALQKYYRAVEGHMGIKDEVYTQFNRDVWEYTRNLHPDKEYAPGVKDAGNEMRKIMGEVLKDLQNPGRREGQTFRPWQGSEDIKENPQYMWRLMSHDNLRGAVREYGVEPWYAVTAKAISMAQPDLPDPLAFRLAKGYIDSSYNRASGSPDEWTLAFSEGDYGRLTALLGEANMDPIEIAAIMGHLTLREASPGPANLKRRMLLDESAVLRGVPKRAGTGTGDLAFADLLDKDAEKLFSTYVRRMSGRTAMARMRIKHPGGPDPETGNPMLVDGITSDIEWRDLLGKIRQWHIDHNSVDNISRTKFEGDIPVDYKTTAIDPYEIENLQFVYDRIQGIPDPKQQTDYATAMRMTRQFMSTRLMGQVGIAQLGETAHPIAHLGLRAAIEKMPALARIFDKRVGGHKNLLHDPMLREIEAMGIGSERLHGFFYNTWDEIGDLPFEPSKSASKAFKRTQQLLQKGERAIYELSGMSFIQQQQHRATANMFIQWFADNASTMSRGQTKRLHQVGMDAEMVARVKAEITLHSKVERGTLTNAKINRLNMGKWTDLEARAALEDSTFRIVNKFIQTNDPSNAAWFMSGPTLQTLLQFRSFPMTAYANQFLYNVHMGDTRAAMSFLWTTVWAAVMRKIQVEANAIGRSNSERYREKYGNPWELAKAGFERSGWSSVLPPFIDTVQTFTGGEAIFNARTSGQATALLSIEGSPAGSALGGLVRGIAGARRTALGGQTISEGEMKGLLGVLPFQNLFGISNTLNYMVQPLPDKAPFKFGK